MVVATPFEVVLAQEAVGRMCPDTVHVLSRLSMGPSQVLAELGSDHLKEKYLKQVAAGECIMPVVIPELQAGLDAGAMEMIALIKGDKVIIDNQKS